MAALVQQPLDIRRPPSSGSLLALSLAHLVDFFESYELQDEDCQKTNVLELEAETQDNDSIQASEKFISTSEEPVSQPLPKGKKKPDTESKTDRGGWFRRTFTMRFGTWAEKKNNSGEHSPIHMDSFENLPDLQVPGLDPSSSRETPEVARASTLPHNFTQRSFARKSNFRPSRSRSLAGRGITALFFKNQMSNECLENSVFLPYNHDPRPQDYPSISDIEDISAAMAEYSTLPREWNCYKHAELRSSDDELVPRTKWGEWRRAKRSMKAFKGKLKLSLALGKRSSKRLRVRFFSPLPGNRGAGGSAELDSIFSPITESNDFERLEL